MTTDTEDDFKAMTGEGIEEGEVPTLIDDDEDPIIDLDDKLIEDGIIDPLLPLDEDSEEDKDDDDLDDKADMEALMWQEYDER